MLRQRVQHGANRVSGKPSERQGKVLLINADWEFFEGRAQNHLLPEHIEKIVTAFDEFRAIGMTWQDYEADEMAQGGRLRGRGRHGG